MAISQLIEAKDIGAIYGIPVDIYDTNFIYKPQIHLYFAQKPIAVKDGRNTVQGRLRFRLINETNINISNTESNRYAEKRKCMIICLNKISLFGKRGKHKIYLC